jgi:flagellar motor protein MotB
VRETHEAIVKRKEEPKEIINSRRFLQKGQTVTKQTAGRFMKSWKKRYLWLSEDLLYLRWCKGMVKNWEESVDCLTFIEIADIDDIQVISDTKISIYWIDHHSENQSKNKGESLYFNFGTVELASKWSSCLTELCHGKLDYSLLWDSRDKGTEIAIHFRGEDVWFPGSIIGFNETKHEHMIKFDNDGKSRLFDLTRVFFRIERLPDNRRDSIIYDVSNQNTSFNSTHVHSNQHSQVVSASTTKKVVGEKRVTFSLTPSTHVHSNQHSQVVSASTTKKVVGEKRVKFSLTPNSSSSATVCSSNINFDEKKDGDTYSVNVSWDVIETSGTTTTKTISYQMSNGDTVLDCKKKFELKEGIPVAHQQWKVNDVLLQDDKYFNESSNSSDDKTDQCYHFGNNKNVQLTIVNAVAEQKAKDEKQRAEQTEFKKEKVRSVENAQLLAAEKNDKEETNSSIQLNQEQQESQKEFLALLNGETTTWKYTFNNNDDTIQMFDIKLGTIVRQNHSIGELVKIIPSEEVNTNQSIIIFTSDPKQIFTMNGDLVIGDQSVTNQTTIVSQQFVNVTSETLKNNIRFIPNTIDVLDECKHIVKKIGQILIQHGSIKIRVDGHVKLSKKARTKPHKVSQASELSELRANSIVELLVEFGVPSNRMLAKGFGGSKPLPKGQDDKRVEITVVDEIEKEAGNKLK